MQNYLLITCEILLVVVMPLLVLYLKGNWPLRKIIPASRDHPRPLVFYLCALT